MSESSTLYEFLEDSWRELARDNLEGGLASLKEALKKSPGNQALLEQIEHLEGGGDPKETLQWLSGSLEILRSPEDKDPDSIFDLFDDVSAEDIIAEGMISAAFADQDTRVVPDAKHSDRLSMAPDDLGERLRKATGKFKIPPPAATRGEATPKQNSEAPAEKTTRPNLAETVEVSAIKNPAFEDFFDDVQVEDGRNVTPLRGVPAVGIDDSDFSDEPPRDRTPTGHFASDLGFENAAGDESDIDFDLGLSMPGHTPVPSAKPQPQKVGREPKPTPRAGALTREPIREDEFFALAESFAAESSGAEERPYRGEPITKGAASKTREVDQIVANPFKQSQPTGVNHGPVEESFVLEEMSQSASASVVLGNTTNLTAIILEARRMYERGEFEPALDVCTKILSRGPNAEAEELKTAISGEIERVSVEKLGSLAKIPTLNTSLDLSTINLDHRSGFLMSQVDGMMALEDILELSSMPRAEALRLLVYLVEQGVIKT